MDFSRTPRSEKMSILKGIIENLEIRNEEKELYFFSMEILDDGNFEKFFQKIMNDFSLQSTPVHFVHQ